MSENAGKYQLYVRRTKSGEPQDLILETQGSLDDVLAEFFYLRDQGTNVIELQLCWSRPSDQWR